MAHPLLVRGLLEDEAWQVRKMAARGLGALGEDAALARALEREPDWRVREEAVLALGALGPRKVSPRGTPDPPPPIPSDPSPQRARYPP